MRDSRDVVPAVPGLGRCEVHPVLVTVERQVLAHDDPRQVLEPHGAGDEQRDEEVIAQAGRLVRLILTTLAGVHQPQA